MSWIVVDVEADGPCPGLYSMVCFGAVLVGDPIDKSFYGQTRPISEKWKPDALKISGFSREQHQEFRNPYDVIKDFDIWVRTHSKGNPIFVSDNPAFDWQFMNYYFWAYLDRNPFGFSARRIGDLYAGLTKDTFARWKHLRKTSHTHHPVDDAIGNVEALLEMAKMGLKIPGV